MRKILYLSAAAIGLATLGLGGPAKATFPEKDITFVIPYGPGGGFDVYVRRIAPVMERYLPNEVNVIPRNIAGAGGRKAVAGLYREKPDGYTIAIFNMPGMLLDKILGEKTNFDIEEFTWLARLGSSKYALAVSGKSGIKSVEELMDGKEVKYAITDWSSGSYVAGRIMAETMGMNVTFLPGYQGSADISLSMTRGDTQLSLFNAVSAGQWAEGGDINLILSLESKSPWQGVPTIAEAGFPQLEALTVDRFVGGPPGMNPDITSILSDAIMKALADKEIQDWAEKTGSEIDPLNAEEAATNLDELFRFYSEYRDALAKRE